METNRTSYNYDNLCVIIATEDIVTTNNYTPALSFDTSKHPSFSLQLINKDVNNTLTYKISTTFDGIYFKDIKIDTDIIIGVNDIYEDFSIGTRTIVYVKSKVANTPSILKVFARLNPMSIIV